MTITNLCARPANEPISDLSRMLDLYADEAEHAQARDGDRLALAQLLRDVRGAALMYRGCFTATVGPVSIPGAGICPHCGAQAVGRMPTVGRDSCGNCHRMWPIGGAS